MHRHDSHGGRSINQVISDFDAMIDRQMASHRRQQRRDQVLTIIIGVVAGCVIAWALFTVANRMADWIAQ